MDFALSSEQEELVRTLRMFSKKELAPHSRYWDRTGEFPWKAWRQMGELGLLGLRIPPAYGGQESDYVTFGLAMEEIARGDFGCTYGLQLAGLAGEIVGSTGTEEVKKRWLPPTARGEEVIALAMVAQSAVLFARTGAGGGAKGVTAFLVPLDLPGVSRSPLHDMGSHSVGRAVLAFDHVHVPASHRL